MIDIGKWGAITWTSMLKAFKGCQNMDMSATDTPDLSGVTSMELMFGSCFVFNGDISAWNTSTITEMQGLFKNAYAFSGDPSSWNVSNVTHMTEMFYATDINADLNNWNTGNVIFMAAMFQNASLFNQDLSGWNTSNLISTPYMFDGATSFDQNLGAWDVSSLVFAMDMFDNVTLSTANYDAMLIGWNAQTLQSGVPFSGGNSIYCASTSARANMIASDGWYIFDAGVETISPTPDVIILADVTAACDLTSLVAPTATANCTIGVTATHDAVFPITEGTTVVTWTYTDDNGNTASQTQNVIVDDNIAPVADLAILPSVNAECDVTSLVPPTATDNCSANIIVSNDASFPISEGTTLVTWTYTDDKGNTSIQTQIVIVDDTIAPVPNLAILNEVYRTCSRYYLNKPSATDECATSVTVTSDVVFPLVDGVTVVTWTYDDGWKYFNANSKCGCY